MARYVTRIESTLSPDDAFAYMADFANVPAWDPSVTRAQRVANGPVGPGSAFELVARFAGRDVPLRYVIVEYDAPRRVVLEARRSRFASRDSISVAAAGPGSVVHYDARLEFDGLGRLADPVAQWFFNRVGRAAAAGMRAALNP